MTKLESKGYSNEIKDKLKQKYVELTDDDLRFAEGNACFFIVLSHQNASAFGTASRR